MKTHRKQKTEKNLSCFQQLHFALKNAKIRQGMDVKVVLKNGSQMDFAMQVVAVSYWIKRVLFYSRKMHTNQLKVWEGYDKLKTYSCDGIEEAAGERAERSLRKWRKKTLI